MELHIVPIVAFVFAILLAVSHASLAPEVYWKKMLPYTAMPKAVTDSLHPAAEELEEKTTTVSVGHQGVGVQAKGGTSVSVGPKSGVGVSTGKSGYGTGVHVGKGGVFVGTHPKGKPPVYVGVKPGPEPFDYRYAATETQLKSDPTTALFFLQKDLTIGTKMSLRFKTASTNDAVFLPRRAADSVPFSSEKLPAILSRFSVNPGSEEAVIMKHTIEECETKGISGEDKLCATSMESMVDYAASKLGNRVEAVSTDAGKEAEATKTKKYTITGVKRIDGGGEALACHKMRYAYAVFYCHTTAMTEAYTVELAGDGGGKVKAAAVCHKDTAGWNPKHLAFQVLKVKPGSVPVCHFLPEDHIVWVRSSKIN
ncbi:hypothetical protein Dimus_010399 [Dionaea muscipula]